MKGCVTQEDQAKAMMISKNTSNGGNIEHRGLNEHEFQVQTDCKGFRRKNRRKLKQQDPPVKLGQDEHKPYQESTHKMPNCFKNRRLKGRQTCRCPTARATAINVRQETNHVTIEEKT